MTTPSTPSIKPVTPVTKVIFVLASILAIIEGIQLYLFSTYTDSWFAWTIAAPVSAAFLGVGYWAGATLLLFGARERTWANVRIAMGAVGVFVPVMLITTLIHLDRFHLSSPILTAQLAGWAWLLVYLLVPFLVIAIWVVQARTPGGDPPRLTPVAPGFVIIIGINAAVAFGLAISLYLFPESVAPYWPWQLTALTSRAIGAGFLALAGGSAQFVLEKDWSRARIGAAPLIVLGVLQLVALARYPGTVNWALPVTWLYLAYMAGILIGGIFIYVKAWRQAPQAAVPAT